MVKVFTSRYSTYKALNRIHRDKPFKDLVNSKEWKNYIVENLNSMDYNLARIPSNMEYRADLISLSVFGTDKLWWLICTANAIIDPMTELTAGKLIKIPIIR